MFFAPSNTIWTPKIWNMSLKTNNHIQINIRNLNPYQVSLKLLQGPNKDLKDKDVFAL